ncbi:CGNR zinc finger domain-containing protein [Catenulispora pinisilvae]|uniref:CGNR zinc finger domain-containing protein n=1 Tax=Catenulispora pinisilvae TaxID=2705253 RepID=UPI001890E5FB|nr:CGNR zinc finger domain-containing protein [Catenulispora pinisilvae]
MTTAEPDPVFRTGSGRLCLDFIRTLRWRDTPQALEELTTPEALAAWVRQLGPYDRAQPIATPTARTLATAQETREAVHALLAAARTTTPADCPSAARRLLNKVASGPTPHPVLDESGTLTHTAADPITAALAAIARDALDLATSPLLPRVRDCANPACGAWFLDTSRPGTRRWCSMDRCGNQAKKNTWRARHPEHS